MTRTLTYAAFERFGGPLRLHSRPIPTLQKNEILLQVVACSLNKIDSMMRLGTVRDVWTHLSFPCGLGFDAAGRVLAVGSAVKKFKPGDRAFARAVQPGTLASHCVLSQDSAAILPEKISFVHAAATPFSAQTALEALRYGDLKEGKSVLILQGASPEGSFAIQLAKQIYKAGRIVTTCSKQQGVDCKKLGADEILDAAQTHPGKPLFVVEGLQDPTGKQKPFDLVFNAKEMTDIKPEQLLQFGMKVVSNVDLPGFHVAGEGEPLFQLVKKTRGMWEWHAKEHGEVEYSWVEPSAEQMDGSLGSYLGTRQMIRMNSTADDLHEIAEYLAQGKIAPVIDTVYFGLEHAEEALQRLDGNKTKGKIVVEVVPELEDNL